MKISVCITSYNQRDYLVEAIESVLNQTLMPTEIIIVDDCSQDGSQDVVSDYASRFPDLISPIFHMQNQGVAQSRTDALAAVTGEYATFLDSDDRYLPTKLEREALELLQSDDAQIAFSNHFLIDRDGRRTGVWADAELPAQGDVFCQVMGRDFPRGRLFRSELVQYRAWKQVGFYDPSLEIYEDWDMRIRLSKHCRTVYCDEPLTEYRIHSMGLSSRRSSVHLTALDRILQKAKPSIDELSPEQRRHVERQLNRWRARLIRRAARESLEAGDPGWQKRLRALRLYARSMRYHPLFLDRRLLLRITLPDATVEALTVRLRRH